MNTELIIQIITMFLLGTLSNSLRTLNLIFTSKKNTIPTATITFIDAILYGTILKKISSGEGVIIVLAYASGRVCGYFMGSFIENMMALGISEVEMFLNDVNKMIEIADYLRSEGYSVETDSAYGYEGRKRYKITITSKRKEIPKILTVIREHGYDNPTIKIRELQKIDGKFIARENKPLS